MKPIIFSAPMIRAIQDGKKQQTRRVVTPQPTYIQSSGRWVWPIPKSKVHPMCCTEVCTASREWWEYLAQDQMPYCVGDVLWVRETWTEMHGAYFYKADADKSILTLMEPHGTKWRPSIFMPREAARIFLRVTDVRVERVQDITEDDAKAEGIGMPLFTSADIEDNGYVDCYSFLWDHLNAKRGYGWDANPWVWVISFERTEKPT